MKAQENNLAKYTIVFPDKRKVLDVRDYIIPSKKKTKTRWSERVDEVVYGKK